MISICAAICWLRKELVFQFFIFYFFDNLTKFFFSNKFSIFQKWNCNCQFFFIITDWYLFVCFFLNGTIIIIIIGFTFWYYYSQSFFFEYIGIYRKNHMIGNWFLNIEKPTEKKPPETHTHTQKYIHIEIYCMEIFFILFIFTYTKIIGYIYHHVRKYPIN